MPIDAPPNLEDGWPWMRGFRRIMRTVNEPRLVGTDLFTASDFSGSHKGSRYNVYSFLLVDPALSVGFFEQAAHVRRTFLDDRRMSFKALNDKKRRGALGPFLEAAEALHGVCCTVAVTKSYPLMGGSPNTAQVLKQLMNLDAGWKAEVFESALRVILLWAILVGEIGDGQQNVTWVIDEDEIAANDVRHTDLLQLTGRISQFFIRRQMGELCVCTTGSEGTDIQFEDFNAVTDLAAGGFCEVINKWTRMPDSPTAGEGKWSLTDHSDKAELITDWYFYPSTGLRRVAVLIDREPSGAVSIKRVGGPSI